MKKPEPQIGQIVRFDYLWRDEALRGRQDGAKDRPCAVVIARNDNLNGGAFVLLAPITHAPPHGDEPAIEIPSEARSITGLDDHRPWLVTSEVNLVAWTDPGIAPARKDRWLYGHLPRGIAQKALDQIRARLQGSAMSITKR